MRAFRHLKQHNYPSHKRSTPNCGLCVLVYTGAQYIKHTPRSTAPYSCARAWPYTRAVNKTARSERCCSQNRPSRKKVAIFEPLKMDGRADGNQNKAFPNVSFALCFSSSRLSEIIGAGDEYSYKKPPQFCIFRLLINMISVGVLLRKAFFGSRQLKVPEICGHAGAPKNQ